MKKQSLSSRQTYQLLKSQLLDQRQYPNLNKMLNLPAFIKQNENLFTKLNNELNQLKNYHKKNEKNIKIKTTPFYLNSTTQSNGGENEKIKQMKLRNELLQKNIAILKEQEQKKRNEALPLLKEKKQQLKQKEIEKQRLQQLNKQLKNALQSEDMLELYQTKCRQCQSIRKVNNQISEQIKTIIKQINQLTGSQENPNMFFMNLKV